MAPVLALWLPACGGSDDGDSAPVPATVAPAPGPVPDPAPAPSPPPAVAAIDSDIIAKALCTSTLPVHGVPLVVAVVPGQTGRPAVYAFQSCATGGPLPDRYDLSSGGYSSGADGTSMPFFGIQAGLTSAQAPLIMHSSLQATISGESGLTDYTLTAPSSFSLPPSVPMQPGTLHEWTSTGPGDTWSVELQVHERSPTVDHPEAAFKICWKAWLPAMSRLTCHVHRRTDGEFVGLETVDDSPGYPPTTWVGWR